MLYVFLLCQFFHLFCHFLKTFIYVCTFLRAHLYESHSIALCQLLSFFLRDFSLRFYVGLISQKYPYLLNITVLICLFYPLTDIFKGFSIINGIGEDSTGSSFEIRFSNISKFTLTSCIPHLQSDFLILYIDCFNFEIDSNGSRMTIFVCVLRKP